MAILYLKTDADVKKFKASMRPVMEKINKPEPPKEKNPHINHKKQKRKKKAKYIREGQKRVKKCKHLIKERKAAERSPMEKKIELILMQNGVDFISEYYAHGLFNDRTNNLLFFDFYLPKYKVAIEFNGVHHYKPIEGEEKLSQQKYKDNLKWLYCRKNGILLLRIPCYRGVDVEKIIMEFFDKHFI